MSLTNVVCPICGIEYVASTTRLKFGRQTTCSVKCSYKLRSQKMQVDFTGKRFGRLLVTSRSGRLSSSGAAYWNCTCACGRAVEVFHSSLARGATKSCGCRGRLTVAKDASYTTWNNMMRRCYDRDNRSYRFYGGKQIAVCDRWHTYANFLADMGTKPNPSLTLERIDNAKSYSPGNCRWATFQEQGKNRTYKTSRRRLPKHA